MANTGPENIQSSIVTEQTLSVTDLITFNQIFVELAGRQQQQDLNTTRSDRRYSVQKKVRLGLSNDVTGEFIAQKNGWVQNISISGVLLFTESPIEPNTTMAMDLGAFGIPDCFVRIRILRCVQALAHTYQIGACFLHD